MGVQLVRSASHLNWVCVARMLYLCVRINIVFMFGRDHAAHVQGRALTYAQLHSHAFAPRADVSGISAACSIGDSPAVWKFIPELCVLAAGKHYYMHLSTNKKEVM